MNDINSKMKSETIFNTQIKSGLSSASSESPIIYIMVIGFHHKFGCQLEFVYPENKLIKKNSKSANGGSDSDLFTLPKKWAHLPSLALPDGSHNYNSDYIYFHLEDEDNDGEATNQVMSDANKKKAIKKKPNRTLFGVSCYRQINASEMLNKDSHVTRNTLQKSVCILSTCPLYATSIRLKLHTITCAYFDQKDFRRTQILVDAFNTTFRNSTAFSDYSINYKKCTDENLIGLSLSDLVVRYQHKILILFKLILLQRKCLFQLKPVSNLSNTIISLISLIPDIFRPETNSNNGLEYCSGYFDSIDLVNSELERKANAKNKQMMREAKKAAYSNYNQIPVASQNKKIKKKRMLSFSSKKKSNVVSNGSQSSSSSPTSSVSSSPVTSNFMSDQSGMKQFRPAVEIGSDANNTTSQSLHNSSSPKENDELENEGAGTLFGKVTNILNWSANSNLENTSEPSTVLAKSPTSLGALTSTPSGKNGRNKASTPSKSQLQSATDLEYSQHSVNESKFQLEELLNVDFGMPFNLFSEFNILHPYLSLYYLEYFTMINKMNTKLYCTTSLMLSMMNAANAEPEAEPEDKQEHAENGNFSNSSSIASSSGSSTSYSNPYPMNRRPAPGKSSNEPLTIGYTIGATNVLFKQRLYDDIDAFIDETSIDIKQNDMLKKQLQLSTADLRFADYLIKHVNASRSSQQKAMSQNNTPTLLSVKKTSNNFCEFDEGTINNPSLLTSSNWEGSDEWIRLNFKWYFYTLLGSMLKEDICEEARCEAEVLVNQITSLELSQQQFSSSSSSTASLANEVVDIDDYIERASMNKSSTRSSKKKINSNMKSAKYSSYSLNPGTEKPSKSQKSRKNSMNQSLHSLNSNNILMSAQNYLSSTCSNHVSYRDDYNSAYLTEFKKTECFMDWSDANRKKLETNLFKLNELSSGNEINSTTQLLANMDLTSNQPDLAILNTRLQAVLRKLQHLDSIKLTHPNSGTMGVHDIKLRFNFLFTTTDSGKKINKALAEGSKIVNTTGRAVGDALSQAKSSFSSFLSNWSNSSSPNSSINNSRNKDKSSGNLTRIENNQKFTNLS